MISSHVREGIESYLKGRKRKSKSRRKNLPNIISALLDGWSNIEQSICFRSFTLFDWKEQMKPRTQNMDMSQSEWNSFDEMKKEITYDYRLNLNSTNQPTYQYNWWQLHRMESD